MSKWKLVPVEPADWQTVVGKQASGFKVDCGGASVVYAAMLSTAPDPTQDEALVMKTASRIAESLGCKHTMPRHKDAARAVLAALKGGA